MHLRLTALLVLLYGTDPGLTRPALIVLCGGALLSDKLLRSSAIWSLCVATLAAGKLQSWEIQDNHQFLIVYICLAIASALRQSESAAYLRRTARCLLTIVFGLATAWKVALGEFYDGTFMYWALLHDQRLQDVGAILSATSLTAVQAASSDVGSLLAAGEVALLFHAPLLSIVSQLLSWLTIVGEGAIAAAFAFGLPSILRHGLLTAFIGTTYWLMPVPGFGVALVVLGLMQCCECDVRWRKIYLALLLIVPFTELRWRQYVGLLEIAG